MATPVLTSRGSGSSNGLTTTVSATISTPGASLILIGVSYTDNVTHTITVTVGGVSAGTAKISINQSEGTFFMGTFIFSFWSSTSLTNASVVATADSAPGDFVIQVADASNTDTNSAGNTGSASAATGMVMSAATLCSVSTSVMFGLSCSEFPPDTVGANTTILGTDISGANGFGHIVGFNNQTTTSGTSYTTAFNQSATGHWQSIALEVKPAASTVPVGFLYSSSEYDRPHLAWNPERTYAAFGAPNTILVIPPTKIPDPVLPESFLRFNWNPEKTLSVSVPYVRPTWPTTVVQPESFLRSAWNPEHSFNLIWPSQLPPVGPVIPMGFLYSGISYDRPHLAWNPQRTQIFAPSAPNAILVIPPTKIPDPVLPESFLRFNWNPERSHTSSVLYQPPILPISVTLPESFLRTNWNPERTISVGVPYVPPTYQPTVLQPETYRPSWNPDRSVSINPSMIVLPPAPSLWGFEGVDRFIAPWSPERTAVYSPSAPNSILVIPPIKIPEPVLPQSYTRFSWSPERTVVSVGINPALAVIPLPPWEKADYFANQDQISRNLLTMAVQAQLGGIFQGDIIIRTAIMQGIKELHTNPTLLEYAFASLPEDALTADEYGRKSLQKARDWFLQTKIPVKINLLLTDPTLPCISVQLLEEQEVEMEATLGDVHYDPQISGVPTNGPDWPPLTPLFAPTSYDPVTGNIGIPAAITNTLMIVPGMVVIDRAGNSYPITASIDASTIRIAPTYNSLNQILLKWPQPVNMASMESSSFHGSFRIGCHVQGEPEQLLWLKSIVQFILLRYREIYFEARGFERGRVSLDPPMWDESFQPDRVFTQYVKIAGNWRNYWPKAIGTVGLAVVPEPVHIANPSGAVTTSPAGVLSQNPQFNMDGDISSGAANVTPVGIKG